MSNISQEPSVVFIVSYSLCLNFFHLLAQKPNLEKHSIYSNKFFHNFHLSKSSFTCPGLRIGGLARRLKLLTQYYHISICQMLLNCSAIYSGPAVSLPMFQLVLC